MPYGGIQGFLPLCDIRGYSGIMEEEMEISIMGYMGLSVCGLGACNCIPEGPRAQ